MRGTTARYALSLVAAALILLAALAVGPAALSVSAPAPVMLAGAVASVSAALAIGFIGTYLVHQPYVIWLGLRIQDQPAWIFFFIVAATLIVIGTWGVWLEKLANAALERVLGGKKKPAAA